MGPDGRIPSTRSPAPTRRQRLWGWFLDYVYLVRWTARGLVGRQPPERLLEPATGSRSPVLLIPGVFENWRFLQPVADHLFDHGHPVHVVVELGYNTGAISDMAFIVSQYIERTDLREVTLVAHSKGGLIAKQALSHPGTLSRVRHVIAINTPFSGSRYASLFLLRSVRMFAPNGRVIRALSLDIAVNRRISSLYSVFDPHIPETSHLMGAENIVLPTVGHFRPLAAPDSLSLITAIIERPSSGDEPWAPGGAGAS